jgi:hypothetical protein
MRFSDYKIPSLAMAVVWAVACAIKTQEVKAESFRWMSCFIIICLSASFKLRQCHALPATAGGKRGRNPGTAFIHDV